jgi:hypothetical protein
MLYLHIVLLNNNEEIDLMGNSGVIKAYNDEYIAYNRGRVYGSGNPRSSQPRITEKIESGAINGQSYALSNPILFSNGNIGEVLSVTSISSDYKATQLMAYLRKIANATYVNDDGVATYLNGTVYNDDNQEIKDISNTSFITVFLPNDEAIAKAVEDGVLPPIENFANGTLGPDVLAQDNQTLENFIKYHIDGTYATLEVNGDNSTSPGTLTVTDNQGRTANVVTSSTMAYNILGNRAIVHVIDNYLTY